MIRSSELSAVVRSLLEQKVGRSFGKSKCM